MIQVLKRAMNVLEHLARAGRAPCVLGDIARAAGLNPATCSRILSTLARQGYVEQEGRRQGYRLGPKAFALAAHGPYGGDLIACAEPLVRELAGRSGETVIVAVLRQNCRYTLCRTEGTQDIQVRADAVLGDALYPFATGRLLLAHASPAEQDAVVAHDGLPTADVWPEARTRRDLARELERLRGAATALVTRNGQIVGLACPIRNADRVVAALGLYLPASRFAGAHRNTILKELKGTAAAISARLTAAQEPPSAA